MIIKKKINNYEYILHLIYAHKINDFYNKKILIYNYIFIHNIFYSNRNSMNTEYKIEYYPDGNLKSEKWYKNKELHRDNEPAHIYYLNGSIRTKSWYKEGDLSRENAPACILYYQNGNVFCEEWYKDGELYRENEPACIRYFQNGNINIKKWYIKGELSREEQPAYINYFENGNIKFKEWYKDGELHNINGPAIIEYSQDDPNIITEEHYYINDTNIDLSTFLKITALFRKKIWRYCIKMRKELLETLKLTDVYKNGSDVCRLICTYVY